ncbi:TfoX/Sxy family protein [Candidatus Villigracilis saccharophilus]|uniref:TfoX/Sxy family protein n=1 Tax=Candidatus Villigracilis saccharophilus TaxID=3140684 RepID=UPI00313688F0|nr:TfoX/Sxy family protein [Anaerolineales bacterium]
MASAQSTVDFLVGQMLGAGEISHKKMFGEYGIYCNGKMVASVCDNKLFIKPTARGRAYIGEVVEESPYPGAKPHFLISNEKSKNGHWLGELIRITAEELPVSVKKKKAGTS